MARHLASAAVVLLLALPAQAQDPVKMELLLPGLAEVDPTTQMTSGFVACMKDFGDAETIAGSFTGSTWQRFDEPEAGLISLAPPEGGRTSALLATDGAFCEVESAALTTGQAGHTLALVLQLAGLTGARIGTDAQGCMTFTLGNGLLATVTSGGQDPVCTSDQSSAVRFTRAAEQ
jgi:hypothetical protein